MVCDRWSIGNSRLELEKQVLQVRKIDPLGLSGFKCRHLAIRCRHLAVRCRHLNFQVSTLDAQVSTLDTKILETTKFCIFKNLRPWVDTWNLSVDTWCRHLNSRCRHLACQGFLSVPNAEVSTLDCPGVDTWDWKLSDSSVNASKT